MKKRIAAWLALGLITVIAGLMLAMTNEVTKDRIQTQEKEAQEQARRDVLPSVDSFEAIEIENLAPLTELYAGKSGDDVIGYVGMASSTGYAGPVQVIAGVDAEGRVTGISVGGSDFAETAGLGAKAKDPLFMAQFSGKKTPVRAVKSSADSGENTIDAITAATITSNAVTSAVNSIASKIDSYLNPDDGMPAEGTTYTASAQGFAGPVAVFVTVKDDNIITGLDIGDDKFAETEGFGLNAKNPDFTKQFIGKTLPITSDEIDAISGATVTTVAVIEALNKAIEDKVVVAPPAPEGTRYTASEKGFAGPVAVFVTVTDEGSITALEIGDDQFAETDGFGLQAKEPGFTKQFIGKALPLSSDDIDTLSGATVTTNAVVAAINRAYEEKLVDETADQPQETPPIDEPVSEPVIPEGARTATASSQGFVGPVAVTIWLNEDDSIASLVVGDDDFAETQGIGTRTQDEEYTDTFVGKKLPLAEGDVDVLSGATVTSKAIVKAINLAAEELGLAAEEAATEPEEGQDGLIVLQASAEGRNGPVVVTLTLNEDHTVASLVVGDETFVETVGIGTRAQEEEFISQFIGKALPLEPGDVDTLSGATITSSAVIEAISKAAADLGLVSRDDIEFDPQTGEKTVSFSSKGYGGPVAVTVSLSNDNTIVSLIIGDENFKETVGIGSKVLDADFVNQFIGKQVPLKAGDVDTIANATVSNEAVIEAINQAISGLIN